MSNKHTAEFKAQIAIEAISIPLGEINEFAKKKGVSEKEVLEWVSSLKKNTTKLFSDDDTHTGHHHASGEDVDLETEDELLSAAVSHGVNDDNLNYKKLIFWTTSGTALVVVLIVALIQFAEASWFGAQKRASVNSDYSQIKEMKAKDQETLSTYGVVDLDKGTYRIPIDQAINNIAEN